MKKIARCECGGEMVMSRSCGVKVCIECGKHEGLERCFCGWSMTDNGNGRKELELMGEQIDED